MKTAYDLQQFVENFVKEKGMKKKKSSYDPHKQTYSLTTMDGLEIDSKIIQMKNGKTRTMFKIDGEVVSVKKIKDWC